MEFLNRVEVQGIVGSVSVSRIGDTKVARFSVLTETWYTSKDGTNVIESTWFNVSALNAGPEADRIAKGCAVNVKGRMKTFRFTDASGAERVCYEIVARELSILPNNN